MTPRAIVQELDKHIVGQARGQARGGDCAAQSLAPHAGRRADAPGDHAQEHPDDRPDRRRQDRDRAPAGAPGAGAVREGRGHQVHRGRLRRPRGRFDHQGAGRRRGQDDARAASWRACATARARPRSSACSMRCCPSRACWASPPTSRRSRAMPRRATSCATCSRRGEIDEREVEIEVRALPMGVEIMAPPGMEEMQQQLQSVLSGPGRQPHPHPAREGARSAQAHARGGGRQAHQRRGAQGARARQCRAERHRLHRRDRQDRAPPGDHRRRRLARRRAARPAAAGRRLHRQHQVRFAQDRSRAVHRLGRVSHVQALGSDPGAAGPLSDPGRARLAQGRGLRAHPDRAGCLADGAVPRAAAHRAGGAGIHARRRAAHRRDRLPGQRAHREHRRAPPAHGDGAAAGDGLLRCQRARRQSERCASMRSTSISIWAAWRRTRT